MKTVKVMGTTIELTTERERRINESLIDMTRLLNKELAYSEDLRNQETIERYENNIARIQALLA